MSSIFFLFLACFVFMFFTSFLMAEMGVELGIMFMAKDRVWLWRWKDGGSGVLVVEYIMVVTMTAMAIVAVSWWGSGISVVAIIC